MTAARALAGLAVVGAAAGALAIATSIHTVAYAAVPYAGTGSGPMLDAAVDTGSGSGSGSGSGTPILAVTPNPLTIGPIPIGGMGSGDITIANLGSGALALAGTTSPGADWTLGWDADCPAGTCTLDPSLGHGSTLLHVTFAPGNPPGDKSVTIQLANSADTQHAIQLVGSGVAPANPALDVAPGSLAFAAQQNTASTAQAITIKNVGNVDLAGITIAGSGAGAALYGFTPTTLALAQGSAADVAVTCTPATVGLQPAAFAAIGAGSATVTPPMVSLACTGTAPSALGIAPLVIDFREVRVNASVAPQTVTLTAMNGALANASASGPAELVLSAPTPSTIAPGTPSTFTVGLATGTEHLNLDDTVTVSAGGLTGTVEVKASITTPAIARDATLDLGTFCIGRATASADAHFTATGTATIVLQQPTLDGGAAAPFTLTYTSPTAGAYAGGGYALAAGATATVAVHANAATAPMDVAGALVWTSDMPGADAQVKTTLAAHFIDGGGAIAPKTITFPTIGIRQLSDVHTVTLQNCDATPLALSPATIADDPAFVDASATPLPAMLAPAATATIAVQFAPTTAGGHHATLSVPTGGGTLTAELYGTALGGGANALPRTGFYACGCRSAEPGALAPIALVLVFARRRRRVAR